MLNVETPSPPPVIPTHIHNFDRDMSSVPPDSIPTTPNVDSWSKRWTKVFTKCIENDDPMWSEYLETAHSFDKRLVGDLNKIVDVLLVHVGIICYLHDISFCLSSNRA
jgi:hypothetical protein